MYMLVFRISASHLPYAATFVPAVVTAGPASVGKRHRSRVGRTPADGRPGSRCFRLVRHVSGEPDRQTVLLTRMNYS